MFRFEYLANDISQTFFRPTHSGVSLIEIDGVAGEEARLVRCSISPSDESERYGDDLIRAASLTIEAQNLAWGERSADLDRAVQKLEAALKLLRDDDVSVDRTRLRINSLLHLGRALNDLNRAQSAVPRLELAFRLAPESRDDTTRSLLLIELARSYTAIGELSKAEASIKSAFELAKSSGNEQIRARATQGLGDYYYELNVYADAQKYAAESLEFFTRLQDRRPYAKALITLGLVASDLYQSEKATTLFTQALATSHAIGYKAGVIDALTYSGHLAAKEGRLQPAIKFYLEAEGLAQQLGDALRQSWITSGLAYVYDQSGDAGRALEYYQTTLKLRLTAQNLPAEASIYRRLGAAYFNAADYQQAAKVLEKAAALYRTFKQWRYLAATLRDLGGTYEALGNFQTASDYYNQCSALNEKANDRRGMAYLFAAEGRMLERQSKFAEAFQRFKEALKWHREVRDPRGESAALFGLSMLAFKQGDTQSALAQLEETIRLDESFRSELQSSELSASYLAGTRRHYETYIDVLMQLHKQNPERGFAKQALSVSERARARALLDALYDRQASGSNGSAPNPEVTGKIENLKQALSDKATQRAKLLRGGSPSAVAALDAEINQLSDSYELAASVLRTHRAKGSEAVAARVLSADEIQAQISDNRTLLLEYALGDLRSYLWVVTRESIKAYELPDRKSIESQVRHYYELLSDPTKAFTADVSSRKPNYWSELSGQSTALARVLLGPLAEPMENRMLVVVADGALHLLPFSALEMPDVKTRSGGNPFKTSATNLIVNNEIAYLPSASVLSVLRKRDVNQKAASRMLAVIADPVFSADDSRLGKYITSRGSQNHKDPKIDVQLNQALRDSGILTPSGDFQRLIASRWEANAISALTTGPALKATDFDANLATALNPALKDYRIIHFATHGVLNTQRPSLSGIVLSLVNEQGRAQPGYLRSIDILEMNLQAELITLSSCVTAIGKEFNGEGMIGLSRAFMEAGSKRVVASLWKVDDVATSELMKEFYRAMLKDGLKPSAALHRAQSSLRAQKRWRSPYYWAGFILQGEWE